MEQVSKASIGKCTSEALWCKWAEWSVRANEQRVTKWLIKNVVIWTWKNVPCVKLCVWNYSFMSSLPFQPVQIMLEKKSAALPFSCSKFSFKVMDIYMRDFFLLSKWADACTKQMHGGLTDGWMDWPNLSSGVYILESLLIFPPCLWFSSPRRFASRFYIHDFLPHIAIKLCS